MGGWALAVRIGSGPPAVAVPCSSKEGSLAASSIVLPYLIRVARLLRHLTSGVVPPGTTPSCPLNPRPSRTTSFFLPSCCCRRTQAVLRPPAVRNAGDSDGGRGSRQRCISLGPAMVSQQLPVQTTDVKQQGERAAGRLTRQCTAVAAHVQALGRLAAWLSGVHAWLLCAGGSAGRSKTASACCCAAASPWR